VRCAAAALSIDNARLWSQLRTQNSDLGELVQERTRQLEVRALLQEQAELASQAKADFLAVSAENQTHTHAPTRRGGRARATLAYSMRARRAAAAAGSVALRCLTR
jgi:hypothetical protein